MTQDTPSIAAIVEGLSEAQKRFLRRGYVSDYRGYWPMYNALAAKGIVKNVYLTPLGEAVRTALQGESQ